MKISRRLAAAVLTVVACTAALPAAAAPSPIPYGAAAEISMDGGRVKYVVSAPEVVRFHEYGSDKPGKPLGSLVRVRVSAQGISGEVEATSVELVYEAPDGLLAGTELPPFSYEKTDLLISKPSTLSAGQRIVGEVYFAAQVPGGKVFAASGGTRQAIWR